MTHPSESARMLHLVDATASLFSGKRTSVLEPGFFAAGSVGTGLVCMAWRTHAAVALAHDPRSPRSQADVAVELRDPTRWLTGVKKTLLPLAEEAMERAGADRLATAGAWWAASRDGWTASEDWSERWAHGLERLWGAQLSCEEALCEPEARLVRRHGLTRAQGEAVYAMLRCGKATEWHQAQLAWHPSRRLLPEAVPGFLRALREAGVEVPTPLTPVRA